jgi:hypothetical protein
MRVMQYIGLLLIVLSALSFCLTLYSVLTTDWNKEQSNWFVGTQSFSIFGGDHYNWFFGYNYESRVVNDFNLFKSFYSPFPSVLGGIYFLVCGIVLWFVKVENPSQWFYCGNIRDKRCVLLLLLLTVGGVLFLCFSTFSMLYNEETRANFVPVCPYQQYGFPLALVGTFLLTLGTFGFIFGITKSEQDTRASFLVFLMIFLFSLILFIFFTLIPQLFSFR